MIDCVFCKIISGEKKEELFYEDDEVVAFNDMNPRTPIHIMIAPKKHFDDFESMMENEPALLNGIGIAVKNLVKQLKIDGKPYTWGFHCGGKQSVYHVHAGLLAGMGEEDLVL